MVAIQLRRPTPIVNLAANHHRGHRRKRSLPPVTRRCLICRGRGLDPACPGHVIAGGLVICGCPACNSPDRLIPTARPSRKIA